MKIGSYAVIFTARRRADDEVGYAHMAEEMGRLARTMPGYLGIESVRDDTGLGITISYWESETAIRDWKAQIDHANARQLGREKWYSDYKVRVAKVERTYEWANEEEQG